MNRLRSTRTLAALTAVLICTVAAAQKFPPDGGVRVLVGYAPGGGTDSEARFFAARIQATSGLPMVIENKPGALGQLAAQAVARAPGDGKTLLVTTSSTILAAPHLQPIFNPLRDLAPVTQLSRFAGVLVVPASSPWKTIGDMLDAARKSPGELAFSTSGTGSMNHLGAEMLEKMANIQMTHVPFTGSGPALTALMGKHVQMAFAAIQNVVPLIHSGELRALGVDTRERASALPDVPTIRESGFPDYGMSNWIGVFAPKQTPPELIARIRTAFLDVLNAPDTQKFLSKDGQSSVGSTSLDMQQEVNREYEKIGRLIDSLNLKQ